jgi:Transmembrane family 220, helix
MFRVLSVLMAVLFAVGAGLEIGHPDAAPWVLIYVAAALVSAMSAARASQGWIAPALIGLAALVWGVWTLARVPRGDAWGHLAQQAHAPAGQFEQARHALALLVIAAWMMVVAASRRQGAGSADPPGRRR